MRLFRFVSATFFVCLLAAVSVAQSAANAKPAPGFSIDTIDKTADPCVDFY